MIDCDIRNKSLGTVSGVPWVQPVESVCDAPIGEKLAIVLDYSESIVFELQEI